MKGMLTILGIAGVIFLIIMFSGCSKPAPVAEISGGGVEHIITENIEVEEIHVEGINVKPIEVKTWDNMEIGSWD